MKTSIEDFRALFSLSKSTDGETLRLWLERNLEDIRMNMATMNDDVSMRHLQGRAQIIMDMLQDLDKAADIMRKTKYQA